MSEREQYLGTLQRFLVQEKSFSAQDKKLIAALCAGISALEREEQMEAKIAEIEDAYRHVLTGSIATVFENSPRALQQVAAESMLEVLYWSIGKKYQSQLKGK